MPFGVGLDRRIFHIVSLGDGPNDIDFSSIDPKDRVAVSAGNDPGMVTVAVSPDNQYLGFFVKYGLMAVLLFVWQAWAIVLPAGRLRAQDLTPRRRVQLHTLVLLNVAVALGGLSQDTLFAERWREFYFAFSGVILGAVLAPPRSEGPPSPVDVTAAAQL